MAGSVSAGAGVGTVCAHRTISSISAGCAWVRASCSGSGEEARCIDVVQVQRNEGHAVNAKLHARRLDVAALKGDA